MCVSPLYAISIQLTNDSATPTDLLRPVPSRHKPLPVPPTLHRLHRPIIPRKTSGREPTTHLRHRRTRMGQHGRRTREPIHPHHRRIRRRQDRIDEESHPISRRHRHRHAPPLTQHRQHRHRAFDGRRTRPFAEHVAFVVCWLDIWDWGGWSGHAVDGDAEVEFGEES